MTAPPADEMQADSDEQPLLAGALTHSLARGSSYLTCASRQDGTSSCAFDSSADREEARKTRNKLTAAICICCVFMCVEVTGGYLANSLAIMSDAVHLLSDVAGFAVALFAVWASSLPGGPRHSYGYHRMEILGALASISGIWAATAFLVYEAIGRVNTPAPVNGKLMLIVASMGVGVNLILLVILGGDHHHIGGNCSHSHGDGHGHGHDHAGHSHSHGEGGDGEGGGCWIHNHSDGHGHGHAGGSHSHAAGGGDGGGCLGHKHGGGGSDSHSHGHDHGAHAHEEGECSSHSHTHGEGGGCRVKEAPAPSHGHNHNHSHSHGHEHGHGSGQCSGHSHSHEHDHGEHAHEDGHGHGTGGNLNMRGAYLHALGDLVQSLGVAVAGAVIYVKPEWHIIDPICTFCFSVLVLATTSRIIRDIFDVLMQSAPRHISVADVQKRIEGGVEGVVGVHDLHIWSLTQSKTVMSLHIQVEPSVEQAEVVHSVHDFARSLGIGHVTVQVELVERGAGRPHVSDTQTVELDVEFGDMSSSPSGSSAEDV